MDRDYVFFRMLYYLMTPEHSDPTFSDPGRADYYSAESYPSKIKGFFWVTLSIGAAFAIALFFK